MYKRQAVDPETGTTLLFWAEDLEATYVALGERLAAVRAPSGHIAILVICLAVCVT